MRRRSACSFLAPALLIGAGACAQSGDYPSLLPRAIEQHDFETPASPPPPVPAPQDPALGSRIDALLGQARQGDAAFEQALGRARAAVSRAGAAGSENWIAAQVAVSAAEGARTPTANALAELDALSREKGEGANPNADDIAAIGAAMDQVHAISDRQAAEIGKLSGSLGTP